MVLVPLQTGGGLLQCSRSKYHQICFAQLCRHENSWSVPKEECPSCTTIHSHQGSLAFDDNFFSHLAAQFAMAMQQAWQLFLELQNFLK